MPFKQDNGSNITSPLNVLSVLVCTQVCNSCDEPPDYTWLFFLVWKGHWTTFKWYCNLKKAHMSQKAAVLQQNKKNSFFYFYHFHFKLMEILIYSRGYHAQKMHALLWWPWGIGKITEVMFTESSQLFQIQTYGHLFCYRVQFQDPKPHVLEKLMIFSLTWIQMHLESVLESAESNSNVHNNILFISYSRTGQNRRGGWCRWPWFQLGNRKMCVTVFVKERCKHKPQWSRLKSSMETMWDRCILTINCINLNKTTNTAHSLTDIVRKILSTMSCPAVLL